MQNPIQKFRQSSIVFEKLGILSENLKTLTSCNYPTVQKFLLKLCTRFLLINVYKRLSGFFFILFRSWIINKNVKTPGFYALVFWAIGVLQLFVVQSVTSNFKINHSFLIKSFFLKCQYVKCKYNKKCTISRKKRAFNMK